MERLHKPRPFASKEARQFAAKKLRQVADSLTPESGEEGTDYAHGVQAAIFVLREEADSLESP